MPSSLARSTSLALVALVLVACRKEAPTIAADDAPSLPIAPRPSPESPMILSAPDGGKIPAPPDVAAPPPDAFVTSTGLASKVIVSGTGETHPGPHDHVTVHYSGWTKDGKMFDSSVVRGAPVKFPLDALIKGWTEGLQLMVAGEQRRFWIPAALAYGDTPGAGRPTGMLVFDVQLLSIGD